MNHGVKRIWEALFGGGVARPSAPSSPERSGSLQLKNSDDDSFENSLPPLVTPTGSSHLLNALLKEGRAGEYLDEVERLLDCGEDLQSKEARRYAELCIQAGQPERFVAGSRRLGHSLWRESDIRLSYFVSLISLGNFEDARRFIRETFLMGYYNPWLLVRAVGEAELIGDPEIAVLAALKLSRTFSDRASPHQLLYVANILMNLGEMDTAIEVGVPYGFKSVRKDALFYESNIAHHFKDYVHQLRCINTALEMYGLRAVRAKDSTKPFGVTNIRSDRIASQDMGGPLVTVAMSTFNSEETVADAIESIVAQSYQNLEIVIVDDASSDGTVDRIKQYTSADRRIRLVRHVENQGTYSCRNRALAEGCGELFVCHDSDDWAHPERIASLVSTLKSNPTLKAAQSHLIRVNDQIGIKPRPKGFVHDDQSSLMFRRDEILKTAGFYLEVRTGADSEFLERLKTIYGGDCVGVIHKPLLVAKWSKSSLSGSHLTGISDGGTFASQRLKFRNEYRNRHRSGRDLRVSRA